MIALRPRQTARYYVSYIESCMTIRLGTNGLLVMNYWSLKIFIFIAISSIRLSSAS